MLSLSSFTVIKSIQFDDVIYKALISNRNNRRVVVLVQKSTTFMDIATDKTYSMPPITARLMMLTIPITCSPSLIIQYLKFP